MSAYLMSDADTYLLAVFAVAKGFARCPSKAATMMRSTNNRALFCRYGERPQALKGKHKGLLLAAKGLSVAIDAAGGFSEMVAKGRLHALASTYRYQCEEGDAMETPGGRLLVLLLGHTEVTADGT